MTSEVTSDIIIELSDINILGYYAFLASKCHYFKMFILPFVIH